MSLILEALRKSDRQRQRAAADRLREGPRPGRSRALASWPILWSALTAILSLLALVAFVSQQAADPLAQNPVLNGATASGMENSPASPAAVRGLSGELQRQPEEVTSGVASSADPAASAARSEKPAGGEAPSPGELANVLQAGLPALHVDVHVWAERPADRFVLINLRRYREGDRIEEGAMIRHIVPEGVVLGYRGERYFLPRR